MVTRNLLSSIAPDLNTMIYRALKVSLLVGTVLNLINSGDSLLTGHLPPHAWKIPLTYLVPFAVSYYSSAAERRH